MQVVVMVPSYSGLLGKPRLLQRLRERTRGRCWDWHSTLQDTCSQHVRFNEYTDPPGVRRHSQCARLCLAHAYSIARFRIPLALSLLHDEPNATQAASGMTAIAPNQMYAVFVCVSQLKTELEVITPAEMRHAKHFHAEIYLPLFALYTVGAIEACTKFWVRPRPGDPWRDAVQREQEEASSYADLLATATATAAATASAAGGAAGAAAVPGLGIGVPAQLPGGIAVQLPGIGATGGLGSIPGLGLLSCCLCPLCSYPSRCCSWPHCKATRHSPTKTTSRSTTTWGPSSNSSRRCCPASWPVP
eukprot:GHRR01036688.1.p1 GENE.GHRR01036688.1~~GHRR01036688.1.p1  ORF type:complete len:303 (-),score=56.85 GHRR01036688.1:35-943(-)